MRSPWVSYKKTGPEKSSVVTDRECMRNVRHLLLLAGMLAAFPLLVCAQSANPRTYLKGMPVANKGMPQHKSSNDVADNRARDLTIHKAEAAEQKAVLLRKHPNARDLQAAIVLFQESARLFEAASAYDRAAGANLQIGEI